MHAYRRQRTGRIALIIAVGAISACEKKQMPDAYGNFEAIEVVVSSQSAGQLQWLTVTEGTALDANATVGMVDTSQLNLERAQTVATRANTVARVSAAESQVGVYESQLVVAKRTLERTQRLFDQNAATAQQRDQAERDYSTLVAQAAAARAQKQSVSKEIDATNARIAQIEDRIGKSKVTNPLTGTVLATYARAGENVQAGQPLYRIANLDTLVLRAYVVENQLSAVKLGQQVQVHVDQGAGKLLTLIGTVSWIAAKAEFTPTPIQTRDERSDLVYAVKILVPNTGSTLKIGMPADVDIGAAAKAP